MFGYVRICKSEMKVKEYETYKAVYCSLCKYLGKEYGILSRLTLSYDFTFLALLNMAFSKECPEFKSGRCTFNPIKKCNYCKNESGLETPAATAMIMLYYKLLDNIKDEKGIKKIGYALLKPIYFGAYKKAAKNYPKIEKIVGEYIKKQNLLESEGNVSLDEAADPTANAMASIFSLCSENLRQKRALERLGYCIGRYVYILDAACDLQEDIKKNSFNALKTREEKDVLPQLYFCINEASLAFELLDIERYKTILGNIIYLGLEETFKKELEKNE